MLSLNHIVAFFFLLSSFFFLLSFYFFFPSFLLTHGFSGSLLGSIPPTYIHDGIVESCCTTDRLQSPLTAFGLVRGFGAEGSEKRHGRGAEKQGKGYGEVLLQGVDENEDWGSLSRVRSGYGGSDLGCSTLTHTQTAVIKSGRMYIEANLEC